MGLGIRRRLRHSGAAVLGLIMAGLTVSPVAAQSPAVTAGLAAVNGGAARASEKGAAAGRETVSLEEMVTTIRQLEERVKELEAKLARSGGGSAENPAPVKAAGQEVASNGAAARAAPTGKTPEQQAEEVKQNEGILSFFRGTEITGFADAYIGYNFNRPDPGGPVFGDNQLRNFDTRHNQFSINLAEIALEKKPTAESRVGFRMDLNFGPATEIVHAFEPPGGSEVFKHIQQGYVSYLAPVGNGLQVDFGKFVTPHGAEVIETKDNWNYSRSLLFALAIPYYHMGLRATYPVNDKLSLAGFVVNGWNNVYDNNRRKSYGAQAIIKPTTKLTIIQNYMGGPEQFNNVTDYRHLFDTTVSYALTPELTVMGNYDYGFDRSNGARVRWQGFAGYLRYQINRWLALAPRFEVYADHDGFTTGTRQTLKEFTITSEQKLKGNLFTRFEYRRDFSNEPYFNKPAGRFVPAQSTLTFGIFYAFTSKGEQ